MAVEGPGLPEEMVEIACEADIVAVQRSALDWGRRAGLSLFRVTRLVTAASELARNIVLHAGRGRALLLASASGGIEIVFEDEGPGIADLDKAMSDGFSTSGSLGLGLPGTRRLVDRFHISSEPGGGTCVRIVMVGGR